MLQGGLDRGGEPVRRLHHDVDHEHPAVEPQLAALAVQVGDGLPDVVDRTRADAAAIVQDAVHGGLAHAGLAGDLPDRVGMGHDARPEGLMRLSPVDLTWLMRRLPRPRRRRYIDVYQPRSVGFRIRHNDGFLMGSDLLTWWIGSCSVEFI